jgi:chromosome segregation ATPase
LINGNYSETSEQSYLKNTIKHLRSELSRYSNLIGHVTEKLAEAEHTINHYSKSAEKCNKELTQLDVIKK